MGKSRNLNRSSSRLVFLPRWVSQIASVSFQQRPKNILLPVYIAAPAPELRSYSAFHNNKTAPLGRYCCWRVTVESVTEPGAKRLHAECPICFSLSFMAIKELVASCETKRQAKAYRTLVSFSSGTHCLQLHLRLLRTPECQNAYTEIQFTTSFACALIPLKAS
jgi:hypothetical protein